MTSTNFGEASVDGSLAGLGIRVSDIVGMASTPDGGGYWLVGSDGGIFSFGDAACDGSAPGVNGQIDNIVGVATSE